MIDCIIYFGEDVVRHLRKLIPCCLEGQNLNLAARSKLGFVAKQEKLPPQVHTTRVRFSTKLLTRKKKEQNGTQPSAKEMSTGGSHSGEALKL